MKIIRPLVQPLSLIDKKFANLASAAALVVVGAITGNYQIIAAGVSLGSSALKKGPKAPGISAETLSRLQLSIDPRTPRKMVLGRTAMNTDVRDQELTDDQLYLHRFVVVASHKVNEISEIWFDDKQAWTLAGGVQGEFVDYLTVTPILEGTAGNAINISARMGTTRRYTGCAYVHLRYRLKGVTKKAESPFATNIPGRVTIIGDGAYVYDPRLDSTVAGGSGSCRADDQSTWIWDDDASRNPALQIAWYLLGWKIDGKLAVGKGIPSSRFNWPAFITAANVCDETVTLAVGGTEPRYRSDGVFSEGDNPLQVLDILKSSMAALLDDVDGKIRPLCLVNDLASPVWSFDENDLVGGADWQPSADLDATFTIVRGSHPDPSDESLYQFVDYPEQVSAITPPDGITRIDSFDLGTVQSVSQCQRLAAMRQRRSEFGGEFSCTMQATGWKVQKGDIVAGTVPRIGFSSKKFRVAEMEIRDDGLVPMLLREEDASIYGAVTDVAGVAAVAPVTFDPVQSAIVEAIAEAGNGSTGGGGYAGFDEEPITAQVQTTAAITFILPNGGGSTITAKIKVDGLSGTCNQFVRIEWRVSGGTYATLGSSANESGSAGDYVFPQVTERLVNTSGGELTYDVRAVTSKTGAGTGTVDTANSLLSVPIQLPITGLDGGGP